MKYLVITILLLSVQAEFLPFEEALKDGYKELKTEFNKATIFEFARPVGETNPP